MNTSIVKTILTILSISNFILADITVQNGESIQDAIDIASDGETIFVENGTYDENLIIEKSLTIKSSTGNSDDVIISGSSGSGLYQSTALIRPASQSTTIPSVTLRDITIADGVGTDMKNNSNGQESRLGGGVLAYNTSPVFDNIKFSNNGNSNLGAGGAIYATSDDEEWDFNDRDEEYSTSDDLPEASSAITVTGCRFEDNNAMEAKSVFLSGYQEHTTRFVGNTFDVYADELETVSNYWIRSTGTHLFFEGCEGSESAIERSDVYVDRYEGSDHEGDGSVDSPFRSVDRALSLVITDQQNPKDVFLSSGVYSTETTDEKFPLQTVDYVSLTAPDGAVMDASGDLTLNRVGLESSTTNIINTPVWYQSSQQTFYFIDNLTLNGQQLASDDWVATFRCLDWNNDFTECSEFGECVGTRKWDTAECGSGVCDLPAMLYDPWTPATEDYMQPGEIPVFVIYSEDIGIGIGYTSSDVCPVSNLNQCFIEDMTACGGESFYEFETGECSAGACPEGFVDDCSGDGDCCAASWIGDGFQDCEDQAYGCDLTCHNNDGGDCNDEVLPGDMNGDGTLNVLDVVQLANLILMGDYSYVADVNSDGVANVLDIVILANIILTGP